jgi:hypothetical protein
MKPRIARGREAPGLTCLNQGAICLRQNHSCSFDHLVGDGENARRNGNAERLGGLKVYDHLELGRKLHREIGRLLAAQDAIDIRGGATPGVYQIGSVGEQTAVSGKDRKL